MHCYQIDHSLIFKTNFSYLWNMFRSLGTSKIIIHQWYSLTHSTSLGPWVLDSGATDHINGNKSFFSSLSTTGCLPSVTMANGYKVPSHGVGTINLFSSLSIGNVLYVPGSLFNLLSISCLTCSLDCVISFNKNYVTLQDRSSGRMIGTGWYDSTSTIRMILDILRNQIELDVR